MLLILEPFIFLPLTFQSCEMYDFFFQGITARDKKGGS